MRAVPRTGRGWIAPWVMLGMLTLGMTLGGDARAEGEPRRRHIPSLSLETSAYKCRIAADASQFEVLDKRSKAVWRSNPLRRRFGMVSLITPGQTNQYDLANGTVARKSSSQVLARFYPLPDRPEAELRVTLSTGPEPTALSLSYEADPALNVYSIWLLDQAFWISNLERGYVIAPIREGLLVPADSGLSYTNALLTYGYEGLHMAMAGMVKNNAAVLWSWEDPYTVLELRSVLLNPPQSGATPTGAEPDLSTPESGLAGAQQVLMPSLVLCQSSKSVQVQFVGAGDFVAIGSAYRELARKKGWLVTWDDKLRHHPRDAQLLGAVNFKPWSLLERKMDEASAKEQHTRLNWTFAEVSRLAEHLKQDLKLERVLFSIGGWIRRGYDNQHPDILPAAPECGGNEGLAACARRVRELGYLFCLHDNYQDIYRDSPSWNEDFVMKNRDGTLVQGGSWDGGRAYLTCSTKALELARRPGNLPAVKQLTDADAYFIDTTTAAGLQECYDPKHPLTRVDDLERKRSLLAYGRQLFGVFGSECGREWAIPCCDFFEGLSGVSGRAYHDEALLAKYGGVTVPFFEAVYRDTVAVYGKYGYPLDRSAEYVLSQLACGRTLNYHEVPPHLYWERAQAERAVPKGASPTPGAPDPALFTRADGGWAEGMHPLDRFIKNTYEVASPLLELTAQARLTAHSFLTVDRRAQRTVFGQGRKKMTVVVNAGTNDLLCGSALGGQVLLPPYGFLVESADFAAFHARTWHGLLYTNAPLFTLRSLDGQPLTRSRRLRVYHGFGEARLRLPQGEIAVERETVWSDAP